MSCSLESLALGAQKLSLDLALHHFVCEPWAPEGATYLPYSEPKEQINRLRNAPIASPEESCLISFS